MAKTFHATFGRTFIYGSREGRERPYPHRPVAQNAKLLATHRSPGGIIVYPRIIIIVMLTSICQIPPWL